MTETQPANIAEVKKPHSIADYGVHFRKGFDSRRHVGSPSLGRKITSYWNLLGEEDADGNAAYTEADLKAIIKSPKAPHAKVIAAQDLLRARVDGYDKIGRIPKAANSIDRIMDRTDGKPTVRVEVKHEQCRSLEQLDSELVGLLEREPDLLDVPMIQVQLIQVARRSALVRERLLPVLEQRHAELLPVLENPIIDATPVDDGR
jgi:hypothetical protein